MAVSTVCKTTATLYSYNSLNFLHIRTLEPGDPHPRSALAADYPHLGTRFID
ncbi:hypothetical protein AG1IA_03200 [Rhizoctonia solani AG-1 IA]|uniref:Uncharacterized protein n=1 Tax=Thanatephorus cucumeris (strain AG1-IA) TaxID=983506 RepID=L8WXJ9_THACA|nr:hypothetical protein AG1IA_03200 [Rhizoctonia solani AG-1 IA]